MPGAAGDGLQSRRGAMAVETLACDLTGINAAEYSGDPGYSDNAGYSDSAGITDPGYNCSPGYRDKLPNCNRCPSADRDTIRNARPGCGEAPDAGLRRDLERGQRGIPVS